MRVVELLIDPILDGKRLDAALAQAYAPELSRAAAAKCIESGAVTINGTPATQKAEKVLLGDRIILTMPEPEQVQGPLVANPDIALDIRFEDDELIVLSKQAGLVCHPSPGHVDDTLANALVAHCGYEHLGLLQGEDRPGIVHRLDMDTSGLMLAAKTDAMQQALQDLIRLRVLDRRYVTLVQGPIGFDDGTITTGIARSTRDRLKMTVSDAPGAREAITSYQVLARYEAGPRDNGYTLVECHLYTGRTHQIRVHMRHIGHPVVGDQLYGKAQLQRDLGLTRQFLHSYRLSFTHPDTNADLSFTDTLPEDLAAVLEALEPRLQQVTPYGMSCQALLH